MSTVLLVDDEPEMVGLVSMCLEGLGAEVVRAGNVSDARAAARADPPGVVLLDLALGREDGLELLPDLRSEPNLASVPVVVFSVHESRRREALERGASDFVPKPFRPAQLRAAVQRYLDGR
jgi:NtrC-family two-component system response regulator AlgB